jgi:hypothetical protein
MKEAKKDLFASVRDLDVDAICITTNGHWTTDGKAVMGGGCARTCADLWPETSYNLGGLLKRNAGINIPYVIGAVSAETGDYVDQTEYFDLDYGGKSGDAKLIFSFPTINDLADGADLELIHRSSVIMMQYADAYRLKGILLPRPGSGIGGLAWTNVKAIIEPVLDYRFTIVSFDHEE